MEAREQHAGLELRRTEEAAAGRILALVHVRGGERSHRQTAEAGCSLDRGRWGPSAGRQVGGKPGVARRAVARILAPIHERDGKRRRRRKAEEDRSLDHGRCGGRRVGDRRRRGVGDGYRHRLHRRDGDGGCGRTGIPWLF